MKQIKELIRKLLLWYAYKQAKEFCTKPFKNWKRNETITFLYKLRGNLPMIKSSRKIQNDEEDEGIIEQKNANYYYGYTPIETTKDDLSCLKRRRKKHRGSLEPIETCKDFVKLNIVNSLPKKKEKAYNNLYHLQTNFATSVGDSMRRTQAICNTYNSELKRKKDYLKKIHDGIIHSIKPN